MNKRQSAKETKRRIERHLLAHFAAAVRMNTISTADIEEYKAKRLAQGAEPATINRELAILRRAYRLALDAGELAMMPRVRLLREDNIRKGFFERQEFEAVRAELPEWLRPAVTFAYLTGWRFRSEVVPLTTDRVDLGAGIVRLDPGTTKSGQGRTFYVTAELRSLLERQLAAIKKLRRRQILCPYLFHQPDGTPIRDVATIWRQAFEQAGYPARIPHDFRRTAVRNLVRAGVSEHTAMKITGHKTRSVFDRYDIVSEGDLSTALRTLARFHSENGQQRPNDTPGAVRQLAVRRTL